MPGSSLDRRDFVRTVTSGLAAMSVIGSHGLAQGLMPRRSRLAVVAENSIRPHSRIAAAV